MSAIQEAITYWHGMHGRTALYVLTVDHSGIASWS